MNLEFNSTDLNEKIKTKMSLGDMYRAICVAESGQMFVFYFVLTKELIFTSSWINPHRFFNTIPFHYFRFLRDL